MQEICWTPLYHVMCHAPSTSMKNPCKSMAMFCVSLLCNYERLSNHRSNGCVTLADVLLALSLAFYVRKMPRCHVYGLHTRRTACILGEKAIDPLSKTYFNVFAVCVHVSHKNLNTSYVLRATCLLNL